MKYIEIEMDEIEIYPKKISFLEKLLSLFIAKANPDFDRYINTVNYWQIEFENEESIPTREVGLNNRREVIMKMPYKENYGYWIDNILTYNDFKESFKYKIINKEIFQENWKKIPDVTE